MELFKSLETRTKLFSDPFKHFEINEPLTKSAIDEIFNADIADPRKRINKKIKPKKKIKYKKIYLDRENLNYRSIINYNDVKNYYKNHQ